MATKKDFSDDPVLKWAGEVLAEFQEQESRGEQESPDKENRLSEHFLRLTKEYERLLRSFDHVTRISDRYQKSLMETNESLDEAARRDPMTGLSNRRDMMERLSFELKRASRYDELFSVILMDIDHFKNVNDNHGHGKGDEVLVMTAKTLVDGIRSEDMCARWGGEEFLVCLPHTALDDAEKVAEKLRLSVASNSLPSGKGDSIHITISAGLAEYVKGFLLDDLIRTADDSLYEAKRLGRNRVCKAYTH
ncbi:MAG: GGDEF domain-containing protein [Spirochaetales bacterium]|nr:GGDEF domain-containing protein [Spirochaetales bacterium]MCF7936966.1 GGDEF domain-containing protein [Spirochaetales bacterium]